MKIFALQTDPDICKKRFIISGEDELLSTHFHWILFVSRIFFPLLITIIVNIAYFWFINTIAAGVFINILYWGWMVFFLLTLMNNYIRWKYSFLFVTTEKVVCIIFTSLFRHVINPTHLDNINSTDVASEYGGLFNCGILHLNLQERTKYSTKRLTFKHVPRVIEIAGAIENSIVLNKQRSEEEHSSVQKKQIKDLRKKTPSN